MATFWQSYFPKLSSNKIVQPSKYTGINVHDTSVDTSWYQLYPAFSLYHYCATVITPGNGQAARERLLMYYVKIESRAIDLMNLL